MTPRPVIETLTIVFILANSFIVKGQEITTKNQSETRLKFDTSTTAIIPLNNWYRWEFDSTYKQGTLTQTDLRLIDSLLIESVADFNKLLSKEQDDFYIDLIKHSYKKQLVPVSNKLGQKEVWVNCFCDSGRDNSWKTEIVHALDGGSCYFSFKINLLTKIYYDFGVNGVA